MLQSLGVRKNADQCRYDEKFDAFHGGKGIYFLLLLRAKLKTALYERSLDYTSSDRIKRSDDICVVWKSQAPGDENQYRLAPVRGHPGILGRGFL